jgi:hypothetical protein
MKPISNKKYLVIFLTIFLFLFTANSITTWFIGTPQGDLVRIGKYSENQFAYQAPNQSTTLKNQPFAQIMVLGDSFSRAHIWQTQIAQITKMDVATYDYHDVGCPTNFFTWLRQETKPTLIIIEVVERMFPQFPESRICPKTIPKIRIAEVPENFNLEKSFKKLFQQDLFFNISATYNTLKSNSNKSINSGKVINTPLNRSDLFTNSKSNRLLYLKDDLNKFKWSNQEIQSSIDGLINLKKHLRAQGVELMVIVVPDKLSVYEDDLLEGPQQSESIHDHLEKIQLSPLNLKNEFKKMRLQQKNLYAPNDSHLSVEGYQLLGQLIAQKIKH